MRSTIPDDLPIRSHLPLLGDKKTKPAAPPIQAGANRKGWLPEYPGVEEMIHTHARKLHYRRSIQDSIPPDLDDFKQDMRLKLIEMEEKYDPARGDPGGFACTILKTFVQTDRRYRSRKCRKEHFNPRSFDEFRDSTHASPADPVVEQVETQDLIDHCKDKLTDGQAELLKLCTEMSHRQIAADLEISRRQLRNMLAEIREIFGFIEESREKADHSRQDGIGH